LSHDQVNFPLINKVIARPYPPGSIAKAMILCGAVAHGDYTIGERIACTGHLFPNNKEQFRCWVYREHYGFATHSARLGHDPDAAEALMVSCNIFYFTLGRRLGSEGIIDTYMRFGLGEHWNLGVGDEYPGQLGSDPYPKKGGPYVPRPVELNEATMMGIGQGPVSWTPLHAADAYATLARGGVRVEPHLIDDPSRPPQRTETGFEPRAIAVAMEGLRRSVNEHDGTGNHLLIDQKSEPTFNAPGVDVWGKTGTAQTSPTWIDPDGPDGPMPREIARDGDHSWFVVLVGPKGRSPKYSIAVMMEYAGSGGKVSGPIVNQIIHALVAEGYLPDGGRAQGGIGFPADAIPAGTGGQRTSARRGEPREVPRGS
jgi:penicillin-binding protein 2